MPVCNDCHKDKPDVKLVNDPFADEVHDEQIPMNLCDDCYQERKNEV